MLEHIKSKGFLFGLILGLVAMGGVMIFTPSTCESNDDGTCDVKVEEKKEEKKMAQVVIDDNDHVLGDINAPITIVEYSDFECPFCARHHETMKRVMEEYDGQVKWVYKHFPLRSIHPHAQSAAEASECAGDQGKFWEYSDLLFENQRNLGEDTYLSIASELDLDVSEFSSCIESEKFASVVNDNYQEGIDKGVRGTPGNFINGESASGALPFEQIKAIIDSKL